MCVFLHTLCELQTQADLLSVGRRPFIGKKNTFILAHPKPNLCPLAHRDTCLRLAIGQDFRHTTPTTSHHPLYAAHIFIPSPPWHVIWPRYFELQLLGSGTSFRWCPQRLTLDIARPPLPSVVYPHTTGTQRQNIGVYPLLRAVLNLSSTSVF